MKASSEKILEEVADNLNQFLKRGNLTSFSKKIDPGLNIDKIEKLLKIHFVLTRKKSENDVGVIDFMEKLSQRMNRIKSMAELNSEVFQGEVRGKINFQKTFKHWAKSRDLFECETFLRNYDVPENLVLKKILQIIHEIIFFDLGYFLKKDYDWFIDWVDPKRNLKKTLRETFSKNVYLKRINLEEGNIPQRTINKAQHSRIPLYRDAANLLLKYDKIMNFQIGPLEAKELLRNTFIKPERTEVLFELYWAIKIIQQFENPVFSLIEPSSKAIAKWENGDYRYEFYHNSCGGLGFNEKILELNKVLINKDNYLGRKLKVQKKLEEMLPNNKDSIWGGRPDLVLKKYDLEDKLVSVFIGEVKYTNNKSYAIEGLGQLLEYIAFLKNDAGYIEKYDDLFFKQKKLKGALFVDDIDDFAIKGNDFIKVYKFGDSFLLDI